MRTDLPDLLKQQEQKAPKKKMTDEEATRLLREQDWRLINRFDTRRTPPRKQDIRPWT